MNPLPLDAGWQRALEPVEDQIHSMGDFLREENRAGRGFVPAGDDILRAFTYPFEQVKVVILGQDPYPTPGHAMGLSFSVHPDVRPVPRSLGNIFKELLTDVQVHTPPHGDLTGWSEQGVCLLNRVLTCEPGKAGSHRKKGWEAITARAIEALAERDAPLVAILWGRDAQTAEPLLGDTPVIASAHPSPLSASRGFFGSRPFSRANEELVSQGAEPVDWRL